MFNAQPTGTVASKLYTVQSVLVNEHKNWLVERMWFFNAIKMAKLFVIIIVQLSH